MASWLVVGVFAYLDIVGIFRAETCRVGDTGTIGRVLACTGALRSFTAVADSTTQEWLYPILRRNRGGEGSKPK